MNWFFLTFFPASFTALKANWRIALGQSSFRIQAIITLLISLLIGFYISNFLLFIESRPGHSISDFILNTIEARDLSLPIFILLYSAICIAIINLSATPVHFLKAIQAYCLLIIIRMFCIYLFPLEPDQSMIPLTDPFVGRFFYSDTIIVKDLFFSGHVSTLSLLVLATPYPRLKYCFITATALVAGFILVQHVHYTIDVLAAPFFSWGCYTLVSKLGLHQNKGAE